MIGPIAAAQVAPGDLILCQIDPTTRQPLDRLIAWVTGSSTIHVAMVHDAFWALEAYWPVLRAWPLGRYRHVTFVRVTDDPAIRAAAVEHFLLILGRRYSLALLLLELGRLVLHRTLPDRWLKTLYVCSTSVARSYAPYLALVPGVSPYEVTPGEIARQYLGGAPLVTLAEEPAKELLLPVPNLRPGDESHR